MALTLIHGNRLERLADRLIDRRIAGARAGFEPDVVAVPSAAMARWLQQRIAGRLGVCAHVAFPYPAQLVWSLFAAVLADLSPRSPFDASVMAWRIFERLDRLPRDEVHAPLAAWVGEADERGRMELAERVGRVYDRYLVFRPDWLQAWTDGRRVPLGDAATEAWQAELWRWLAARTPTPYSHHPKEAFFERLARIAEAGEWPPALPRSLAVFAAPTLPPLYLEVFVRLAERLDVDLYLPNPCRHYWADIAAEREIARLRLRDAHAARLRDVGHPLLASWGAQARDGFALVGALIGEPGMLEEEHFEPPDSATLLARLQRAILELAPEDSTPLEPGDISVRFHDCHGLTRQIETLHDALHELFARLPGLAPHEIVVMTPDIEAAAPLVDAVFGGAPPRRAIPYSIAGRARPGATPLLRAFDTLLGLPASRFDAATIMDLIETPSLARRFGLGESDLEQIRDWLQEAGVRWGLDADHRARLGLPAEPRHTWAEGLARLLAGYALPADEAPLLAGLAPYPDAEGTDAVVIGRLARVLAELDRLAGLLATPRPPADWARLLGREAHALFEPEDAEHVDLDRLRGAIAELGARAEEAGSVAPIGVALVRKLLSDAITAGAPGALPGGAVTFCGIGALRGLPFRVVCLLGMDDDAFPRSPAVAEFDLAQAHPRLGDRAQREDDRGAFLDALLGARDALLVLYTGRDAKDNTERAPCVVVAELLEHLGRILPGGPTAAQALVTRHALQPFSPRNFAAGAPRSFAAEYLPAARRIARGASARRAAPGPFDRALPEPGPEWRAVDLERLVRFFRHPARFLLRERLGVSLDDEDDELRSEEPFVLEGIDAWRVRERLVAAALAGADHARLLAHARAATELPHGAAGAAAAQRAVALAERLAKEILAVGTPRAPQGFERTLGEFTVSGPLDGLTDRGARVWRAGRCTGRELVEGWVRHLALNWIAPADVAPRTTLVTADRVVEWSAVQDAPDRLAELLELYWRGLAAPLPLFPRTSLAGLESASALRSAWSGRDERPGERQDAWIQAAWGGVLEAPPPGTAELAAELFGPLSERMTERPLGTGAEP